MADFPDFRPNMGKKVRFGRKSAYFRPNVVKKDRFGLK